MTNVCKIYEELNIHLGVKQAINTKTGFQGMFLYFQLSIYVQSLESLNCSFLHCAYV